MTNLFGHSIRSELLALYLIEVLAGVLAVCLLLAATDPSGTGAHPLAILVPAAILAICSGVVSGAIGLYQPAVLGRASRLLVSTAIAGLLLVGLTWPILRSVIPQGDDPQDAGPLSHVVVLCAFVTAVALARLGFLALARGGHLRRRIAYVEGTAAAEARQDFFELALVAPVEALTPARLRAQGIWAVVASDLQALPAERRAAWRAAGLRVFSAAEFAERRFSRVDPDSLPPDWLAAARAGHESRAERLLRRAIDLVIGLALLVVTLPVLLFTALAIKLDSPGPVFYRQERVGRGGRVFTLFKFRSMVVDAEAGGAPRWATQRDPRVTRVGRFIRLTRIDEIPQVLNVLRGDMAFIGPRPERPAFVEQLGQVIPRYHDRAVVKPGITGWAQVNYPYGASVEDARMKLAYDLYYIRRRSLFLDLLILLATVRVVLFQEGSR